MTFAFVASFFLLKTVFLGFPLFAAVHLHEDCQDSYLSVFFMCIGEFSTSLFTEKVGLMLDISKI